MKIACCIFSYNVTKGMKSIGPIGSLKKNNKTDTLILQQIKYVRDIFRNVDIYIVTGFGASKLLKDIPEKKYIHYIDNDQYENKNYGYALNLFLKHITSSLDSYDGVFFLDSNIIIKSLTYKKIKQSWVVLRNISKKNKSEYLGAKFDADNLQYLFYNIGNKAWCKSFYLTKQDLLSIIETRNFHDNMFIFEILNKIIEDKNIKIQSYDVHAKNDCVEILGLKDKNKIK
tara:strand:+ start:5169 stop:5855 length:687 start_codon:yes stop_codon:yes gene_type:complete